MSQKNQAQDQEGNPDPKSLISEEEVKQAIHTDKGEGAQLTSFEVVDFTKPGDNCSNYVTSVEVKYSMDDEEHGVTYVAKVNPCRKMEGFEEINHQFFKKEVKFYTDIVPELNSVLEEAGKEPLQVPKLYHANLEMGKEQAYYEDLRERGFKMVDRLQSLDAAHVTLVLREMAKLHAASILLQGKSETCIGEKHEDILIYWKNFADNPLMSSIMQGHLDRGGKILKKAKGDEKAVQWLEDLKPKALEILGNHEAKEAFKIVAHGAPWSNNLLFRYNDDGEPEEVMLLDFETCIHASLAYDLNTLMYTSLSGEVRKEHLEEFMNVYTTAFKEVLEAGGSEMPFNEEELMEEFRENNTIGGLFAVITLPAVLLESGDLPDVMDIDGDIEEALEEYWCNLDEKLETSPTLRPRYLAMFEEFLETGLIS